MEVIIQGFIIAIFVILSGVFIRLGLILEAIEERKGKGGKSCATCAHAEEDVMEAPCNSCITDLQNKYKNWEAK